MNELSLGKIRCLQQLTNEFGVFTVVAFDHRDVFVETLSKRRKGFPSETKVKCGVRVVHGEKLLDEKLGRNDLCPCGSGTRFKRCCLKSGRF